MMRVAASAEEASLNVPPDLRHPLHAPCVALRHVPPDMRHACVAGSAEAAEARRSRVSRGPGSAGESGSEEDEEALATHQLVPVRLFGAFRRADYSAVSAPQCQSSSPLSVPAAAPEAKAQACNRPPLRALAHLTSLSGAQRASVPAVCPGVLHLSARAHLCMHERLMHACRRSARARARQPALPRLRSRRSRPLLWCRRCRFPAPMLTGPVQPCPAPLRTLRGAASLNTPQPQLALLRGAQSAPQPPPPASS